MLPKYNTYDLQKNNNKDVNMNVTTNAETAEKKLN